MKAKKKYHRDDVLAKARELAKSCGESLTLTTFQRDTGISQRVIYDLFGSWKCVRTEVGLQPDAPRNSNCIGPTQILEQMKDLANEHGNRLTLRLFLKETGLSERMIVTRFGSWSELRKAVGLSARATVQQRYTDEEIILDLYRVYRVTRERPVYDKHKLRGGRISPGTICHRLGSWQWACWRLRDLLRGEGHLHPKMGLPESLEDQYWTMLKETEGIERPEWSLPKRVEGAGRVDCRTEKPSEQVQTANEFWDAR